MLVESSVAEPSGRAFFALGSSAFSSAVRFPSLVPKIEHLLCCLKEMQLLYFGAAVDGLCCNTAIKKPPVSCKCGYMRVLSYIRSQKNFQYQPNGHTTVSGQGLLFLLAANDSVQDALPPFHQEARRCSHRTSQSMSSHGRPSEAIS